MAQTDLGPPPSLVVPPGFASARGELGRICDLPPSGADPASFRPLVDVIGHGQEKAQVRAGVLVSLYEESGEATAVFVGQPPEDPTETYWSSLEQWERDRLNRRKSLQRTKSTARRYATANVLTVNWTLTNEGVVTDRRAVIRHVNRFMRKVRDHLGEAFPYLYVVEWHPGGHGYHVHLLLQERFIDKHRMQSMWGGIVWFSRHNRDRNGNRVNRRNAARIAAGYLLKYVSKDWEAGSGQHCYERSAGFNHPPKRRLFRSFVEARQWLAVERDFVPVVNEFRSEDLEDWHGPPVEWLAW